MKPIIFCLAMVSLTFATQCLAQTGATQANNPPETTQSLAQRLLREARGPHHRTLTPEDQAHDKAIFTRFREINRAGEEALRGGDFVAAEGHYRESIKVFEWPYSYFGLGEALAGQGRIAEAVEAYRGGIYERADDGTSYAALSPDDKPSPEIGGSKMCIFPGAGSEVWMKYVLLLNQTGQGAEALTIYRQAVPAVPDVNAEKDNIQAFLDIGSSSPAALQAAAHVALGLCATFSGAGSEKAIIEFDKGRRLQPDSALTNYYYGFGWQRLNAAERAKVGSVQQARAALQKAILLGKGDLKRAARKVLKDLNKSA